MPKLDYLISQIDWDDLFHGMPGRFHGDLHLENIILKNHSQDFIFIDWREDFAGMIDIGDIYYDLAKILHSLIVSHEIIEF